jgi:hypothetical protein
MRAGPTGFSGRARRLFLGGRAAFLGGLQAFLGGLQAFLGGLSLNRVFCSKDSLLPILRVSKVQNINHIKLNHRSPAIAVFYPSTRLRLMQADAGFLNHVQAGRLLTQAGPGRR